MDGRPVALGGQRPRALFALLALMRGRVVTVDQLIDELWGEEPPARARDSLQMHVSRLRKGLADAGADGGRLVSHAGGYRLEVRRGERDVDRWQRALDRARRARADGELRVAREGVEEALGVWRGAPLGGASGHELLAAERARLEEERLAATIEGIELDLELGRHGELLGQLEALVIAHPFKERLVELQMLALYRCGRQADALAAFHAARARFVEELGIEPSQPLRELHENVLRHADTLDTEPGPLPDAPELRASRHLPVPHRRVAAVPRPPNRTIGREGELAKLVALLRDNDLRLVTLTGFGGVGKTRLAVEAARAVESHYTDDTCFISLEGLRAGDDVPTAFADALGVVILEGEATEQALVRAMSRKHSLLVVDNCEHSAGVAPLIVTLLESCPRLTVLATSRAPLEIYGERRFPLAPLAVPPEGAHPVPPQNVVALPAALRARREMVGRDREFAETLRFVRSNGAAHVVLIAGEAGIGKSTLAHNVAQHALPASVLYGRCDKEPLMPFQLFAEALRDLLERVPELGERLDLAELARIVPELGGTSSAAEGERHRLFEAVASAIAAAGDPVLLVAEDVHWADAPTLTLLRYLIRRARGSLVILATSRDAGDAGGPIAELAVDLRRSQAFERIRVAGLNVEATGELIARRTGMPSKGEFARATHARTNGNPFFIELLLDAGVQHALPEGIKELITDRVAALSAESGETLRIASAIGRDFELRDLEPLVAGREAAIESLDAARSAGLIVETAAVAGRFSFVHAVAREAIYDGMSATRRASLHQHIGEALEQREPTPAPALAYHFQCARHVAGPDKAVAWAIVAAQQAASALAWEQEIAHYESALRMLDESDSPDDAARCRILLALADRWVSLGGEHRSAYRRAAELATRHGWSEILAEAATAMTRAFEFGRPDVEGIALLERALGMLGEHDSAWRARVLARLADSLRDVDDDVERRRRLAADALAMARRTGDGWALAMALGAQCEAIAGPDTVSERLTLIAESLHVVASFELDPDWELSIRCERVMLLLSVDPREAFAELERLAEHVAAHRFEQSFNGAQVIQLRAARAVIEGQLDEAERLAEASRTLFERIGDPDSLRCHTAMMLTVRLEQDRTSEIADRVAELVGPAPAHTIWRAARCRLNTRAGRHAAARNELAALVANDCAAIPRSDDWLPALVLLADAATELKDTAAGAILERLLTPYEDRIASFFVGSAPLGPIAHSLGRLQSMLGDSEHAMRLLQRALTVSEAIPAPRWAARSRADLDAAAALRQG